MPVDTTPWAPSELDELCVNTIRFLAVDAVQKANSGHPGMPMGAAAMAYVLWTRHMRYNPANPQWFNRDRFILSAGHGSMLLYSLLYLTGHPLPLEQIKQFRQWHSITPGHTEREPDIGVEVTTGPLGQGFGNGVGMAAIEAHLGATYNKPGFPVVDHYTYAIVSDGDIMEGVAAEAASLAGHLRLGKLIYLYDCNHVTLSGAADLTLTEDHAGRFTALGWHTLYVEDGNDMAAIDKAITTAKEVENRPSLIIVRTHIGYGSPHKHDTFHAHGEPLGVDEVKATKENLGWPLQPDFYVPDEVLAHFREACARGALLEGEWNKLLAAYEQDHPELAKEFKQRLTGELPAGWDADIKTYPPDPKGMATRTASGETLNAIAQRVPLLFGGSADLNPSTYTELKGMGEFKAPNTLVGDMQGAASGGWGYNGRNIAYGVREHAMGAMSNGMAAHGGVIPFTATFFIFSDYMRPTIRLGALSKLHLIHVFTHDSIGLGEDGPTHQPVEQLPSLRAIPRLSVIRPADANETTVAWRVAMETRDTPVCLVLTRQKVPVFDRANLGAADGLRKGAYVLADTEGSPDILLIASGSEVQLILGARQKLAEHGVKARVISMPSWDLFEQQSWEYKDSVLLPEVHARLSVEAASPLGWHKYVGDRGVAIGVTTFGASAPGETVLANYGFTVENVTDKALMLLGRK